MKSFFKKAVAASLSALMLISISVPAFAASGSVDYTIISPYETVDWDTWGQYKSQLHAHTLYSNGEMDIKDVVEAYYALDYDVLAITDHGVVNRGWDTVPEMMPLVSFNQYTQKLTPLSAERYREVTEGTDRGGRGMLDVPMGIEMNAVVVRKNHVNGYFCGYGQGVWGNEEDYETPVAGTQAAGGLSVINHPGDFFNAGADINRASDQENLKTFTDIFMKYDSCVGMEAFNSNDHTERYDRIVWDNILMYTVPRGRVVWSFSNDDSHDPGDIGLTAEIMLMPENTVENLRTAMENGTFFACSKRARLEMGNDFTGTGDYADISRITVDEENDIISIDVSDYDTVEWIADGEIIATGTSLNLRQYSDKIGSYVRFQVKNAGGILLSQPFVCDDGHMEDYLIEYPGEPEYDYITQFIHDILELLRKTILGELLYKKIFL